MHLNLIQLQASIEELSAERYTPAGVLATDLRLQHQSIQVELNEKRQVTLSIRAIAFDEIAYQLRTASMQTQYKFSGFLASRGRTQQVVLHITEFEPINEISESK